MKLCGKLVCNQVRGLGRMAMNHQLQCNGTELTNGLDGNKDESLIETGIKTSVESGSENWQNMVIASGSIWQYGMNAEIRIWIETDMESVMDQ